MNYFNQALTDRLVFNIMLSLSLTIFTEKVVVYMIKQVFLTREGLQKLEEEMEELKTVKRKEIAEKIKVALSFGDLSENSEYDEAKNEQAIIESRIIYIENVLKNVTIIDENAISTESIHVGSKIKIRDIEFKEDCNYRIVGSNEADPEKGLISDESPIGSALLGHAVGDVVQVDAPVGIVEFKVLEISK